MRFKGSHGKGFNRFKGFRMLAVGATIGLVVAVSGCGYALAGRGSFLPDYIRVVGIPPLENRTGFIQVEEVLTEKVRAEFIGRGTYSVRLDAVGTDAVLSGEIIGISVQPVAFTDQQLGSRYLITMTLRAEFTDTRTSDVLWSNDALTFREEYDLQTRASGPIEGAAFIDQERSSVDRISTDIARTVVTAILEAF
jgi:hypothetical protein